MKLIRQFQIIFIAVIATVSAYARVFEYVSKNSPSHQRNVNREPSFGPKRPALRSSFGGESFHDSRTNGGPNTMRHGQLNRRQYRVRDGHAYGAHSGEYFNKESDPWPYERQRRHGNKY